MASGDDRRHASVLAGGLEMTFERAIQIYQDTQMRWQAPGDLAEAEAEELTALEDQARRYILAAPCETAGHALAKLTLGVRHSIENGERTDGLDVQALDQVIAFLVDQSSSSPPLTP